MKTKNRYWHRCFRRCWRPCRPAHHSFAAESDSNKAIKLTVRPQDRMDENRHATSYIDVKDEKVPDANGASKWVARTG